MTKGCLFCGLDRKPDWENDHFYFTYDVHPVSPGHGLIVPKEHIESFFDLDLEHWQMLYDSIQKAKEHICKTDFVKLYRQLLADKITEKSPKFCETMLEHIGIEQTPTNFNIGINEGIAAGRTIDHLHIQIIPRYEGDIENPIGGIRNIIPKLGDYTK